MTLSLALLSFALAHAELLSSSPQDGATVTEPLSEVVLTFSEPLAPRFSTFKVYPLPIEAAQAAPEIGASHGEDIGEGEAASEAHEAHSHEDSHEDETHAHDEASDHAHAESQSVADEAAATLVAQVISIENDEDARVDTGVQADGGTLTLSLQAALPAGDYVVMWRAPSADGHLVEGFITFSYDPAE